MRLATSEDAADVARLISGFRDWQGRALPDDATIADTVRQLLADLNTDFLVAGDPAAGVCQLRYRLSVWTGTEDCCLEDLFVHADARGSGLGRELVGAALERARQRGCARMDLDANEANEPALELYRSVGFGSWSDAAGGNDLFMRLRL
ncbi:MAG TPA: GNAT family N-acetyltransferase [Thermoleophilaceae bacterium]|nr:GNAT family N-acetyltransferase [Thermoleophilaceae bacterium]